MMLKMLKIKWIKKLINFRKTSKKHMRMPKRKELRHMKMSRIKPKNLLMKEQRKHTMPKLKWKKKLMT